VTLAPEWPSSVNAAIPALQLGQFTRSLFHESS